MAFRINHIHLKAPDPRKTAEWYVKAFNFKIMSDETRVFGDRFVRCQSEDGGMAVNISGARTGETLQPGNAEQTVEVTGSLVALETEQPSLGTTIELKIKGKEAFGREAGVWSKLLSWLRRTRRSEV